MTFSDIGKQCRMGRIFCNNKTVIVPVDDSLISGPKEGLFDLSNTLKSIASESPNAIMGFKGTMESITKNNIKVPFIYNITASTMMNSSTRKVLIASVENAMTIGADCVAAHINFSSCFESDMLHDFSLVANECDRLGMPLLAIAYPRKELNGKDYNYIELKKNNPNAYAELVAHCVRVVCELGADIVKTQYTGSIETFKYVTDSAANKPIVIAGGSKEPVELSLKCISDSIKAGGAGISFGRNVFNATHISQYISAVKDIIFNNYTYEKAISQFYDSIGGKNGET